MRVWPAESYQSCHRLAKLYWLHSTLVAALCRVVTQRSCYLWRQQPHNALIFLFYICLCTYSLVFCRLERRCSRKHRNYVGSRAVFCSFASPSCLETNHGKMTRSFSKLSNLWATATGPEWSAPCFWLRPLWFLLFKTLKWKREDGPFATATTFFAIFKENGLVKSYCIVFKKPLLF